MFGLGAQELLLIPLIALFFFGGQAPRHCQGTRPGAAGVQTRQRRKNGQRRRAHRAHEVPVKRHWKNFACTAVVDLRKIWSH